MRVPGNEVGMNCGVRVDTVTKSQTSPRTLAMPPRLSLDHKQGLLRF